VIYYYRKYFLFLLLTFVGNIYSFAQLSRDDLQQYFSGGSYLANTQLKNVRAVKIFYERLSFNPAWTGSEHIINCRTFFNDLEIYGQRGLNQKDYAFYFIESFKQTNGRLPGKNDSLLAELKITDAAIHFYNEVAYGNTRPDLGYNGLGSISGCHNIPALLAEFVIKKALPLLSSFLSPSIPEINKLEGRIKWFHTVMTQTGFSEVIIKSGKINQNNKALLLKLYQLGIIDSSYSYLPDSILKQKVKEAQRQFNLLADGSLRSTILSELNIPIAIRLQQLNLSVNYYRWMHCISKNNSVIVVNIPAAYLKVYRNDKVMLEMRVIVGKTSTPTHTIASKVNEVILYPYWHVPYSIATKELLPSFKRNAGNVNAGNYQVLNSAGKIMDPYSINWHALSQGYFPYLIRQSTGCDNSLGLLKLNFYNPFGAYLHDTPGKNLFMLNKRFFSHGCMRMEKPMDLGHLVLKNNAIAIDSLEQKGCLRNQSPITVPADEQMPVIVWYNPAGIDSTGRVIFYEDVYNKFTWLK
jgi:L,D-transpeptidase YcbB